jgi:hypothetical protein
MSIKIRVLELIESVVHTRKWVSVLKRNLVNTAVVNAESKRAISFLHTKNRRAELIMTRSNQTNFHCVFEMSVKLNALRM